MTFTATEIAKLVNGKIIGNPQKTINYVSSIEKGQPNTLSFLSHSKYSSYLKSTKSNIVLITKKFIPNISVLPTLIVVKDPYYSFNQILRKYARLKSKKKGIEKMSTISSSAQIGINCYIGSFSYIDDNVIIGNYVKIFPNVFLGKNVQIGHNTIIGPGVKIYDECIIGDFCIIQAGSVIGSDGFGFESNLQGYHKIPHLGNVRLENYVEIGANSTIDRGTIDTTTIKCGTKIDNLVHIGHNVTIGSNNIIASQTGIAGSTKIGDWNMIGGQSGFIGNIKIGNYNKFQGQVGVNTNIGNNKNLYGSPAFNAFKFKKCYIHFKNLSKLVEKWNFLEKSIKKIKETNDL